MKRKQSINNIQFSNIKSENQLISDVEYKKQQLFSFISNKNLSNICVPVSGVFWVLAFVFANENKISPIQLNFARYICQMVGILLITQSTNQKIDLKNRRDFPILLLRSLISVVGSLTVAFFQNYLPLTVYYTINSSTTIFAFVLNHHLFGIKVTAYQIKTVLISVIGIVLVINGRFIYHFFDSSYQFKSNFQYNSSSIGVQIFMGILAVIWCGVQAYGIIITGKHKASFHAFIFINSAFGHLISSSLYLTLTPASEEQPFGVFISQPSKLIQILFYCGLPIFISNYIFMLGIFISTNTGISTMLVQLNIVYGYFISKFRYDEAINYICLTGAILLIGSIYTNLFSK